MSDYDQSVAGVQMTLAGLAYLDAGKSIDKVRSKLQDALKRKDYATGGEWELVWGPVVDGEGDNLMYLARRKGADVYSVVLRGTVDQGGSIWEDIPTGQEAFAFVPADGALVSSHFVEAFRALVEGRDARRLNTLGEYLVGRARGARIYVTGHSQGGGLTSLVLAWLAHLSDQMRLDWQCAGYAFAPPTAGNPAFARWIGERTDYYAVINPLDVVPFGYASIKALIREQVPDKVPEIYHPVIDAAADEAEAVGDWQHPNTRVKLRAVQLPHSVGYLDQIAGQHNHNSYLYLLGAPQTDGDPSPLPPHDPRS